MSLYDVAMKMETDSRDFYLKQAESVKNEGLKKIFQKLAADEQRHYEYLKGLVYVDEELKETDVLVDVKNVFTKMLEDEVYFDMDLSTIEAYEFAKRMEADSAEYYHKMQEQTEDAKTINLLKMLEQEERKHFLTLENIILYMKKPETWVESAEFTYREEY